MLDLNFLNSMKIASVLNVHTDIGTVLDTIESIRCYMTDNILVVIDGASKKFESSQLTAPWAWGFSHGRPKAPFKNVALALKLLVESHPGMDWYNYIEYDCLVTSGRILSSLQQAQEKNIFMLGNDGRIDLQPMPFVESLVKQPLNKHGYYLIGACQFFSGEFIAKLQGINFFDRFLNMSNGFGGTDFPAFQGYDISEHMYPTLARHFGGNIGVFASWDGLRWHGNYEIYPVRWKPELDPEREDFAEASIMHPLKSFDHPIRVRHREKRKQNEALSNALEYRLRPRSLL